MRRIALGTLLLALCSASMASPIYKWVDAQGTTHFGAQPPENVTAETVHTYSPPPSSHSNNKAPNAPLRNAQAEHEALEADVKAQIAEQNALNDTHCKELRTSLIQLENNPRILFHENGETRRLGEDERQEKIADAKKKLAENCR